MPGKKVKKASTGGKSTKRKTRAAKIADDRPEVDILSPAAVINAYYICHNVADCLNVRGFPWQGPKKKGKKKKKKK